MSSEYEVGYGKPPKHTQFKPGNKAAKGKRRPRKKPLSIGDCVVEALDTKRKIKRGDQVLEMPAGKIMVERMVQMMTTGTARDVGIIFSILARFAPQSLSATAAETIEVLHHRAEGSKVPLPPAAAWKGREP